MNTVLLVATLLATPPAGDLAPPATPQAAMTAGRGQLAPRARAAGPLRRSA